MSDLIYWIALSMLPDIGPVRARKLLRMVKTPEKIFDAQVSHLINIEGMGQKLALSIKESSPWGAAQKVIEIIEREGMTAITLEDPRYPVALKQIEDAPIVVYMRGDIQPCDRHAIAIVGSRRPTHYGASVAERMSEELASMGFTVVSGMARGIDSISHKGALKAGGRTIAVLGSGLDRPYPPENKILMEKITYSGCVLSEFTPGTPPDKENFPRRNRIISGLCLGVLVVEATSDSGSLITAAYALDQNREVFAVPGSITSANSEGTNKLIRRGAILTRNAEDIIKELAPALKGFIRYREKVKMEISEEERELCTHLSGEPKQIDSISRESGLPTSRALAILLELELKGAVRQTSGKRFYLA
ncbi:MAG: DNA-processing protein DprA [Nitrospirota bacterium]